MARKPIVSRTITSTEVVALCINLQTEEPFNKKFILSGTYKDNKALLKAIQKQDTDEVKAVHVVDSKEVENLYGMAEEEFISLAEKLDPKTRKPFEQAEVTE